MEEPTVLRTARVGGFVKEDVMTYLDELNSKIVSLENELKEAKENGPSDPQELIKYRNQVDNLQEKLNASNNALRAAKKENEELQKTIDQLKAGGPGAAAAQANAQNAANAAALDAAKKEIDNLKAQLKAANDQKAAAGGNNAQANAQAAAALETAKKEIETLRAQLKAAEQKAAAAPADGAAAGGADLAKAQQEIARITGELNAKTKELTEKSAALDAKTRESADKDAKIAQLAKDAEASAKKDEEISRLNSEIAELKETGNMIPSSFDMGALFTEAQKTAGKITVEAQRNADKVTKDANDKAEQILRDANAEAEKTINNANTTAEACIKEANEQAKNTVDDANAKAKATIDEANSQAKTTVDEANAHADKVNEMSATVRNMLLNEIESVNTKFGDITSVLNRLTGQATDRMSEAQLIIGEARKTLDSGENSQVKKAEAPKADFKAAEAPKGDIPELKSAPASSSDPFANLGSSQSYNNGGFGNSGLGSNTAASKPAAAPAPQAPQQPKQPAKKSANFNFDMAELLKAAEEEAAKESND